MGEANIQKWIGIRPTDPAESIPITKGTDERKSTAETPANKVKIGTTSTQILDAETTRSSFIIRNTGGQNVYIRLGTPATTDDLTLEIGDVIGCDDYTGEVTGIVASGEGEVRVIEV